MLDRKLKLTPKAKYHCWCPLPVCRHERRLGAASNVFPDADNLAFECVLKGTTCANHICLTLSTLITLLLSTKQQVSPCRPRRWKGNGVRYGNKMCYMCKGASASTWQDARLFATHDCNIYTNVWPNNPWQHTLESHAEFLQSLPFPNELAQNPMFRNWMLHSDLLHVLYRGVLAQFLGSVIVFLAGQKFWNSKGLAENLQVAYRGCVDFLASRGCRVSLDEFTLDNLRGEHGYPELPGKATDGKMISFWILWETTKYCRANAEDQMARVLNAFLNIS